MPSRTTRPIRCPAACRFFITSRHRIDKLLVGIRAPGTGRLFPKLRRDRDLPLHAVLDLVFVKDLRDATLLVPGSGGCVARDAADGCLRGAAGIAAFAADTRTAARRGLAVFVGADAGIDLEAAGVVLRLVLDVAGGQRTARVETVLVVVDGRLGAGDGASCQGGAALHVDRKAAVPCPDAALLCHVLVVAVGVGFACTDAAPGGHARRADGDAGACVFAALRVGAGVLEALDGELAANVGLHAIACDYRALDVGVAPTHDLYLATADVGAHLAVLIARDDGDVARHGSDGAGGGAAVGASYY